MCADIIILAELRKCRSKLAFILQSEAGLNSLTILVGTEIMNRLIYSPTSILFLSEILSFVLLMGYF